MRTNSVKNISLLLLLMSSFYSYAQKSDSAKKAIAAVKEDLPHNKKRKFFYFVSDRVNEDHKYDIFKIIPTGDESSIVIIKGHADIVEIPKQKKVKISVYNISNNELVGIYNTNSYTGNYRMVLVPNIKYLFKVETPGYVSIQQIVEVPLKIDYEVGRQEVKILLNEQKKPSLFISSAFSESNEKIFQLRAGADSTKKELEVNSYAWNENKKIQKQKLKNQFLPLMNW